MYVNVYSVSVFFLFVFFMDASIVSMFFVKECSFSFVCLTIDVSSSRRLVRASVPLILFRWNACIAFSNSSSVIVMYQRSSLPSALPVGQDYISHKPQSVFSQSSKRQMRSNRNISKKWSKSWHSFRDTNLKKKIWDREDDMFNQIWSNLCFKLISY